ncbi:MAG: SLATT domain-containing protein [Thalassobaculaceae bacterium]|nr:SLATT domain-containing protein [Thalassobaculaceae bacterium]
MSERSVSTLEEAYNVLLKKIGITKGARFQSSVLHRTRNRTSTLSVIILSMYVILFSSAPFFLGNEIEDNVVRSLNLITIVMSAFVVVFTLYENSKRHELRAENFLKCAQNLSDLYDKVLVEKLSDKGDWELINAKYYEYNKIMISFPDNHSELELQIHFSNTKKVPPSLTMNYARSKFNKIKISLAKFVHNWSMPIIALSSPFVIYVFVLTVYWIYLHARGVGLVVEAVSVPIT